MRSRQKRRKNNKRKKARERLPGILARQHNLCHYCSIELVHYKTAKELYGARSECIQGQMVAIWTEFDTGILRCVPLATIEHLVPLSEGGSNHSDNLVASCYKCNYARKPDSQVEKREPIHYGFHRSFDKNWHGRRANSRQHDE